MSHPHPREAGVRPTRSPLRITVLAAGLFAAVVFAPAAANAAPAASFTSDATTAGTYYNAAGRLVVTVTDPATAKAVEASGAVAQRVTRSGAALKSITDQLYSSARIVGTGWAVDPATNQVVVSVDSSVTGNALATVEAATKR